jgi:hypothetical protein
MTLQLTLPCRLFTMSLLFAALAVLIPYSSAFNVYAPNQSWTRSTLSFMTLDKQNDKSDAINESHRTNGMPSLSLPLSDRRQALTSAAAAVTAVLSSVVLPWPPQPAVAAVSGVNKVNAKLTAFGLPPYATPPADGFVPILETWGKGKNRFPLLVTFAHPLSWVVTLPSNTVNGEEGTIQAGDYGKGDTATLYVYTDQGAVPNAGLATNKPLIETVLKRSISQRGDNMYQNFKLTKITAGPGPYLDGQSYVLADFKYQLLTGAGFEVDRKGVAAITSQGPAVQVLWAASTDARYKKTEPILRNIVGSFRCYADGINLSDELVAYTE